MAAESLPTAHVRFDTDSWVASLVPTLAVFESGTPKGRSLAKQNLQRMAEVADLAISAVRTIERIVTEDHVRGTDVRLVMAEARRLSHAKPADNTCDRHCAPSPDGDSGRACGALAKRLSNLELPLDVCHSASGYYIGTYCDAQPYTRESVQFWTRRELAVHAMNTGDWTQRDAS